MSREINASDEFARIDGERGASDLSGNKKGTSPGAKTFLFVCITLIGFLAAFLLMKASQVKADKAEEPKTASDTVKRTVPELKIVEPPAPVVAVQPVVASPVSPVTTAPDADSKSNEPEGPSPEEVVRTRRLSGQLISQESNSNQNSGAQSQPSSSASGKGPLADNLTPVRLSPAVAGTLNNRDLLLTQGAMLDCQLETKIITAQPGMTSCFLTRDIYSTNGRVVLLDRGSKVVGQYQSGISQGQDRIFVLWTRVETPEGVIINLDSPGTGSLGEAGLGGYVDTHFWQRFGAAIMLSLIDDIGSFVSDKAANGENTITFENTSENSQSLATEALKNTIDIPPTLYKNQGERLSIFVARDLDFTGVYSLERR